MKLWRNWIASAILALCLTPTIANALMFHHVPRTGPEYIPAYTETDANNRYSVTSFKVTASGLTRSDISFIFRDMGPGHFSSDLTHFLDVQIGSSTTTSGLNIAWALTSLASDLYDVAVTNAQPSIYITTGKDGSAVPFISLVESQDGSIYSDRFNGAVSTTYYLTIIRSGNTMLVYIFSDANRASLLDTLSLPLHEITAHRYVYVASSYAAGGGGLFSGFTQNLDLKEY